MNHLLPGIGRTPALYGFFDFVENLAVTAATVFGGPIGGAAASALLSGEPETLAVGKVGGPVLTQAQLTGVSGTAAQIIKATGGATAAATGGMRKITIVQTLNAAGQVVKQKTTKGGVAVFQSDVTAANRVARQVRRLEKRMPRKLVKQSETARLKEEVTEAALRRARDISDHHHLNPPRC